MNSANILQRERKTLFFLSMFIGLLFISRSLDNDIWFLLSHGRYVVQYGWPTTDPLSMHEGLDFVMQQWLSAVIFWESYVIGGESGPIAVVYVVSTAIIYAYYRLLRLISQGNRNIAVAVTALVMVFVCALFMVTRPQIFSLLIFILTVYLLEKSTKTISWQRYFAFFLLSVLLINLHAAMWPLMAILVVPYLVEKIVRLDKKGYFLHQVETPWCSYALLFGIILAAGFLNPYGIDAMSYTAHSYGIDTINQIVGEMHPLTFNDILGKIGFALIAFLIVLFSKERFPIRWVLISLGMTVLALSAHRSFVLFVTLGLLPTVYYFRHWQGLPESGTECITVNKRFCVIMMLLILATYAYGIYHSKTSILLSLEQVPLISKIIISIITVFVLIIETRYGEIRRIKSISIRLLCLCTIVLTLLSLIPFLAIFKPEEPLTKQAVDTILSEDAQASPTVWTNYDNGDYAEFKGLRPYIDTRAEVYLKANNHQKDILQEYYDLETAAISYQEFLSRYHFNYILTVKKDFLYTYLKEDPDYQLILEYEGKEYGQDNSVRLYKPVSK